MDTTVRVGVSFESWNKFTAMRRRRQMNIMAGKLRETLTVNNEGKTLQKKLRAKSEEKNNVSASSNLSKRIR